MNHYRQHGQPPYTIAVLHGGPGLPGSVRPLAQELARSHGVLEPLQTKTSVDGQIEELHQVLCEHAASPITLLGWSWGAMLGIAFTGRYPQQVKKLILIGSGAFQNQYVAEIMDTRLARLSRKEQEEVKSIMIQFDTAPADHQPSLFQRLGDLMEKADAYDPLPHENEEIDYQPALFRSVWADTVKLRQTGFFVEQAKHIRCPVVAIHGEHDPHPAEGVEKPLSPILPDFRMIQLKHCGHTPWYERQAKGQFLDILNKELA